MKKPAKQKNFTFDEAVAVQNKTLKYLIRRAKITAFGEHYLFSSMAASKAFVTDFCRQVPVHTYNDMYVRWWYRSLNGETYVTWPGKIKYYITKDLRQQITGKTIPVSRAIIQSYMTAGERYMAMCTDNDHGNDVADIPVLDFYKTYYGGALTAILSHHNPVRYRLCMANCFVFNKSDSEPDFLLTDVGLAGLRQKGSKAFKLVVDNHIFYEFIPFEGSRLSDKKALREHAKNSITLSEVVNHKDYILLLTNNSGAWRYFTGQVIRFTRVENLEFMVMDKVKINK